MENIEAERAHNNPVSGPLLAGAVGDMFMAEMQVGAFGYAKGARQGSELDCALVHCSRSARVAMLCTVLSVAACRCATDATCCIMLHNAAGVLHPHGSR